jgi:hypothetical protein
MSRACLILISQARRLRTVGLQYVDVRGISKCRLRLQRAPSAPIKLVFEAEVCFNGPLVISQMANGFARQMVSRRVVALCFVITLRWLFAACGACSVLMLPLQSSKRGIFSAGSLYSLPSILSGSVQ